MNAQKLTKFSTYLTEEIAKRVICGYSYTISIYFNHSLETTLCSFAPNKYSRLCLEIIRCEIVFTHPGSETRKPVKSNFSTQIASITMKSFFLRKSISAICLSLKTLSCNKIPHEYGILGACFYLFWRFVNCRKIDRKVPW